MGVRDLPPLRQHIEAITPNGRHYRWGEDEPDPANVPSGLRHSSTMPGGYESLDVTLPRKSGIDYSDLERLSTVRVIGAGGDVAGEYRLERTPRVSGDQMAISPSAVGWQAHLDDDKSAQMVYIDRDLSNWRGASVTRRAGLATANFSPTDPAVDSDASAAPALRLSVQDTWASPTKPVCEAFYDAGGGALVASLFYTTAYGAIVNTADANWSLMAYVQDGDGTGTSTLEGDQFPATASHQWTPATARRYAALQWLYNVTPGGLGGADYSAWLTNVAVIGNHGLTIRTDGVTGGFYGSDVVADAVARWAPLLSLTVGETVIPSDFVLPHLVFSERTTAAEIVRQASRFGLQDWAVWDDKTFYWHDRGVLGRKWRARISPAQLEETGPQIDRVWESVVVQYQDVDGSTRTVGPPGSGADTEDAILHDSDPENPANKLGIVRRDLLQMGVSTVAGATEIGRQFLEQTKLLDTSGRARIVGHVEDDRGALHPYWRVRAGDQISFIDAADISYRRIIRADHDRETRTCNIDLDAPPEGLQALLERLGVVLVSLGL